MKKLDHNEAVKALREGKVVVAHSQYISCSVRYRLPKKDGDVIEMFTTDKWLSATGDAFIVAEYFTLEEQEEDNTFIRDWLEERLGASVTFAVLRNFYSLLRDELDKRYVRK